jgi:6-phosphogluconate dehydrogenase
MSGGSSEDIAGDWMGNECGQASGFYFSTLTPPIDTTPRTPRRENGLSTAEHGFLHSGPAGARHFVKMVHNGIEYGLMAAYAEGLNILQQANIGKRDHTVDAETSSLRDPEAYQYELNLADIAEF